MSSKSMQNADAQVCKQITVTEFLFSTSCTAVSRDCDFFFQNCIIMRFMPPPRRHKSDDAVWRQSVWRLSHTYGRRAACTADRLDGTYWLIGPGSAGLAKGCRFTLPLQAWAGAYCGSRPPTACWNTICSDIVLMLDCIRQVMSLICCPFCQKKLIVLQVLLHLNPINSFGK